MAHALGTLCCGLAIDGCGLYLQRAEQAWQSVMARRKCSHSHPPKSAGKTWLASGRLATPSSWFSQMRQLECARSGNRLRPSFAPASCAPLDLERNVRAPPVSIYARRISGADCWNADCPPVHVRPVLAPREATQCAREHLL